MTLIAASDVSAYPRGIESPIANPDLDQACGLNILMILDESGSIGNNDDDVRTAFKAFTAAIQNTSSSMAVAEFSKVARLPQIGPFQRGEYITVTTQTKSDLDDYVDNDYDPGGNTNWEDGLRMGRSGSDFAPRPDFSVPHLTVFITDGDPTRVIRGDKVTDDEYLNKVPLNDNETANQNNKDQAADAAVANANSLKAQGSHILAVAVGNGVSSSASLNRIQRISGPDIYDGSGTFDITTDDVYRATNFADLEVALREAAFQLCAPSVTVAKVVDETPDPNSLSDALPGVNWAITGTVSGNYDWVLPTSQSPGVGPQTDSTDASGFATFQWRPQDNSAFGFSAVETLQPGYSYDAAQTECTFRTPDAPVDAPLAITPQALGFSATIPQQSIVTCRFVNLADPAPSILLEKLTDGQDADLAPGPSIPSGDTVFWTYRVTNNGNTRLDNVVITDVVQQPVGGLGQSVAVACPGGQPFSLDQGESIDCEATGTAGLLPDGITSYTGQYENFAEVTATDSTGIPVVASDPSHHVVVVPGIRIEKSTNGVDADSPTGPLLALGSPVIWEYVVTNTGGEALANIQVSDDDPVVTPVFIGGDTNGDNLLDLNESWTYQAFGSAVAGQYANRATATGDGGVQTVMDEDPSHYFGSAPALSIQKSTNGQDADTAPGPEIPVGDVVTWLYEVTNTGNVPLTSWIVEDDQLPFVRCPRIVLLPGNTATCSASGVAATGQYANVGTVTASDPAGGGSITATDPSHYFGALPGLTMEKLTNGEDADVATGPYIPVGDSVTWTYEVTNNGNVTLDLVSVVDTKLAPNAVTCDDTVLDPNETANCSASGTAAAGQYTNLGLAIARPQSASPLDLAALVGAQDPSHYFGAAPGIGIEKFTDGVDADTPADAVRVNPGDVVEWGYVVFNTGNEPLLNVEVTDDQGLLPLLVEGDTNGNGDLDPDEIWLFEATGIATAGAYTNIGTVTAVDVLGTPVSDSDPSNYLGVVNEVVLEKSTNGVDADLPPGPNVVVGSSVTWEYRVTNNGTNPLENPTLVDDQGVIPVLVSGDNGNGQVDPGETWIYTATGSAVAGQYANLATFDAISVTVGGTEEVSDTDPSHYFGGASSPAIVIEKFTNGIDADTAPGALIEVGEEAFFAYVVANTGDIALNNISVTDDQGVTVTCVGGNPIPTIGPGQFGLCVGSTTATVGQYRNVGTAQGTDLFGAIVSDSDPSHHLGFVPTVPGGPFTPAIDIEKSTNGEDADVAPGPELVVGANANFAYVVSNTGDTPLANVRVLDDQGVAVTCPSGNPIPLLPEGGSETCSGSGTVTTGQYQNIGTATADAPERVTVTDTDPSHHRGVFPMPAKIPTLGVLGLLSLVLMMIGVAARHRQ